MSLTHRGLIIFIFLILLSASHSNAADLNWTGAIDNNWHNANNWSPAQVPTFDDNVTVNSLVMITGSNIGKSMTILIEASGQLLIQPSARLIIKDQNSDYGITLDGRITNNGGLVIESSDGGILTNGIFSNAGTITIKNIEGIGIVNQAGSVFQNDGLINIDSVLTYGVSNEGNFENDGTIKINHVEQESIFTPKSWNNQSILTNNACGFIIVNQGLTGSSSSSDITNEGWIEIRAGALTTLGSANFINSGVIEDMEGPSKSLNNINNTGFIFYPIDTTLGVGDIISIAEVGSTSITRGDSLYIDKELRTSAGRYYRNDWTVGPNAIDHNIFYLSLDNGTCSDTISILLTTNVLACNNNNTFLGTSSKLWSTDSNWSTGSKPLACENVIIDGKAVVVDSGAEAIARSITYSSIRDSLTIENGAKLTIAQSDIGIKMKTANYLINEGTLTIEHTGGDGIIGTSSANKLINKGTLSLLSISGNGISDNGKLSIDNSGTINLKNIEGSAITIADEIINTDSILIESVGNTGIHCEGLCDFSSSGYVKVDSSSIGVYIEGNFDNTGQISILNTSGSYGLYIESLSSNSGDIKINGHEESSIYNDFLFTNSGSLVLSGTGVYGLVNGFSGFGSIKESTSKRSTSSVVSFYNSGILKIDGTYQQSISNQRGIQNDTCGIILNDTPIENTSEFLNYGLLECSGGMYHTLLDTIKNYGIVNMLQNSVFESDIGYIANHGCYFNGPIQEVLTVEVESVDIFDNINNTISLGQTVYLDSELTTEAGTYDQSTNTWTPNRTAISRDSFYLNYDGLGNICSESILITLASPIIAPLCDSLNFTQELSGLWTTPINWDLQRVPDSCDIVYIGAGISVGTVTSDTAYCNLLTIETSATFEIPSGGTFIVKND